MNLSARLFVHRAHRTARRAARERRRDLERALAAQCTPAQRCDLSATLDRWPDAVTDELRDILARQARARDDRRWPAIGRL